jgi:non-ribosomal peptide synthetase component F
MPPAIGSIAARIVFHAARSPAKVAVVDGSARLTYDDLERQSNELAALLREAGAKPIIGFRQWQLCPGKHILNNRPPKEN